MSPDPSPRLQWDGSGYARLRLPGDITPIVQSAIGMELINAQLFQYVVQELQMYVLLELQDLQPNNSEV